MSRDILELYLVKPVDDQDDEGEGGDQLLPDLPLGGVKGVANHPAKHEQTPQSSQPAHCLHYLQKDFQGLWVSVTQFHAEDVIDLYTCVDCIKITSLRHREW